MEAILQWDGQALLFIQEHIRQVWMDGFWKTITHLGDAGWFWIMLGIVLLIPKKTRKAGIAALAALAIGALITNVALKNIIARIRPYEVVEGLKLLIEPQSDFSFPSGHTCASIGAALAMYPFLERKWGIPLVILQPSLLPFISLRFTILTAPHAANAPTTAPPSTSVG